MVNAPHVMLPQAGAIAPLYAWDPAGFVQKAVIEEANLSVVGRSLKKDLRYSKRNW